MSRMVLTDELRDDYQRAFAACVIREERAADVEALTETLLTQRARYQTVGKRLNLPWFVVAALHYADTGCDFDVHPHNGDPLSDRTQHLPDGRPVEGEPPFAWEDSITDALCMYRFDQWRDWSIAGTLFMLEGRGGWGYRLHHPEVPSPYVAMFDLSQMEGEVEGLNKLGGGGEGGGPGRGGGGGGEVGGGGGAALWNDSTHYRQGKYVTDDTWNENAIAQRCGAAVLLRRLAERGLIEFTATDEPAAWPLLHYDETVASPWIEALQRFLNTLPGFFVKVDGRAGPRTSEAFRQLTGLDWPGDRQSGHPE